MIPSWRELRLSRENRELAEAVSELAERDTLVSPSPIEDQELWERLVNNPGWKKRQVFCPGFGTSLQAWSEIEGKWVHIRWL